KCYTKKRHSVGEPVRLLAKTAEHTRLGDANRHRRNTEHPRRFRTRLSLQHNEPKRLPRLGLEVGFEQLEQSANDMRVVLAVPRPAQLALGIFQLIQRRGHW